MIGIDRIGNSIRDTDYIPLPPASASLQGGTIMCSVSVADESRKQKWSE
jgi:hypothetical protein